MKTGADQSKAHCSKHQGKAKDDPLNTTVNIATVLLRMFMQIYTTHSVWFVGAGILIVWIVFLKAFFYGYHPSSTVSMNTFTTVITTN